MERRGRCVARVVFRRGEATSPGNGNSKRICKIERRIHWAADGSRDEQQDGHLAAAVLPRTSHHVGPAYIGNSNIQHSPIYSQWRTASAANIKGILSGRSKAGCRDTDGDVTRLYRPRLTAQCLPQHTHTTKEPTANMTTSGAAWPRPCTEADPPHTP